MRIQDLMSKHVIHVSPETSVAAAREKLRLAEINHLVVMDGERVAGVVAGRDLRPDDDDKPVRAVMTTEVVTIAPQATLRRAAGIMRGRAVDCLVVLADGGRLAGIVTTSDLLTALAKGEIHAAPPPDRVILRKRGPKKRAMPVISLVLAVALGAAAGWAQQLSMGNAVTSPNAADYNIGNTRTIIDMINPANATGSITAIRFYWSAACMSTVKIKFYRRTGNDVVLVAERGPFNTVAGDNSIALSSPVAVQQGDLIGYARVANCGAGAAMVGIVTAGSLAYPGDFSGTHPFDDGVRRGEVAAVSATGTATERLAAVIPVVGSTAGSFGSQWRTAVQVANCFTVDSISMPGRFVLHKQGVPGSSSDPAANYSIPANRASAIADIVASFGTTGLGSVDVIVPVGKQVPAIVTRVFNDAGSAGTSGFSEPLVDPTESYDANAPVLSMGSTAVLLTPTDPAQTRFNIGVRTLFSGARLTATLKNANGTVVTSVTKTYPPTFFDQVSAESFFGGMSIGANQMVVISVNDGSVIVYGSATDNVTNDPSIQFATYAWAIL